MYEKVRMYFMLQATHNFREFGQVYVTHMYIVNSVHLTLFFHIYFVFYLE